MHQHKLVSLVQLRSIWDSLCVDDLINVIKHLFELDHGSVYKKSIISRIFQQLYNEGESNDDVFFSDLLAFSLKLQQSEPKSKSKTNIEHQSSQSQFSKLPDGVLCNIATYLPARIVLTKWNLINRKFVQIGLNPASIKHFTFDKRHSWWKNTFHQISNSMSHFLDWNQSKIWATAPPRMTSLTKFQSSI